MNFAIPFAVDKGLANVFQNLPMKWILNCLVLGLAMLNLCAAEPQSAPAKGGPSAFSEADKTGGFVLGCQAYSFRDDTALEAIEKTKACGGKVIEFFTWQKLGTNRPGVELNANLSDADIK